MFIQLTYFIQIYCFNLVINYNIAQYIYTMIIQKSALLKTHFKIIQILRQNV